MITSVRRQFFLALCGCVLLAGCAEPPREAGEEPGGEAVVEDEVTKEGESLLLQENALAENGVNLNGVNLNGVNLNALQFSALSLEAQAAIQDPGAAGALARHALRYIVSCALGADADFDFSWTDGDGVQHGESYPGLMALAPSWQSAPLSDDEAKWVSACLISRVNRYGTSVMLSSRGDHARLKNAADDENAAFTHREGTFWGNLFSATPTAYACFDPANMDHARQAQRSCAAGHVDAQGAVTPCGVIQIVGSCEDFCQSDHPQRGYYRKCSPTGAAPDRERNVITVFLE